MIRNEHTAASLYLACTHHAGVAQDMHAYAYLTPVIHSSISLVYQENKSVLSCHVCFCMPSYEWYIFLSAGLIILSTSVTGSQHGA